MKKLGENEQENRKRLIVVAGPTGVGKSDLAFRLALHFDTEIISADSRQIYRGLDIGTSKPSETIRQQVRHYFIDHIPVETPYSASQFEREALEVLKILYKRHDLAILCGGTGLYIWAICHGLDPIPEVPLAIRSKIEEQYHDLGLNWLQSEVERLDPDFFETADIHNPRRLIRALSVYTASGKPFSRFLSGTLKPRSFSIIPVLLNMDRAALYNALDNRVDQMIRSGWESEARKWYAFRDQPGLRTMGYSEWFSYFDGEISRESAIETIKKNTRRYAKRQLTWFRKYGDWKEFKPDEFDEIAGYVIDSHI